MKGVLEIFFFSIWINKWKYKSTIFVALLSELANWIENHSCRDLNVILHRFFGYFMVEIKKEGGCVLYVMCTMG
jgi:hypothetical protein